MLKHVPVAELHDPFLFQTVRRLDAPETVVRIDWRDVGLDCVEPAGLIFHVGRCGSTLISQVLKQADSLVVYAEPLAFNEILAPPHRRSRAEIVKALRSLGAAFARHAKGAYVVKCSSWVTLFADVLTEAFPNSPWIFGARDPLEVGFSYMQDPPKWFWGQSEQARAFAQIIDGEREAQSKEERFALLYAAYCDAIARCEGRQGRLIDYSALPEAVWEVATPHFQLALDVAQRQRMLGASRLDAKKAARQAPLDFVRDSEIKRVGASEEIRRAVDAIARPSLDQLKTALGWADT